MPEDALDNELVQKFISYSPVLSKLPQESELTGFLFTLQVASATAWYTIEPYLIKGPYGEPVPFEKTKVYLLPDAPPPAKAAATFLRAHEVAGRHFKQEYLTDDAIMSVFRLGQAAHDMTAVADTGKTMEQLGSLYLESSVKNREKGRKSAKLTPAVTAVVKQRLDQLIKGGLAKKKAAARIAAELLKEHGIEVGPDAILKAVKSANKAYVPKTLLELSHLAPFKPSSDSKEKTGNR